jgi:hypothetical protein
MVRQSKEIIYGQFALSTARDFSYKTFRFANRPPGSRYAMALQKLFAPAFLLLVAVLGLNAPTLPAQSSRPIAARIGAIDESSLVVLRGNHHPLATPANDRGEVSADLPMERMLLILSRDPATESSLQQLVESQQDKSSPAFHSWLSPLQFAEKFGVAPQDIQTLTSWLAAHGFRVNRVAASGMAIEFTGTAAQVKQAFHTPIHAYMVDGAQHYANSSDPQIPAALSPVVAGIATLHNFPKQPAVHVLGTAHRIGNTSSWQPDFTFSGPLGVEHFLAPGDFAKIYNTAPLYTAGIDGTGQSIAIVARNNINLSDIQIFRIAFGLPTNDPHIIIDGPDPGNFGGPEETEADLDLEWSGAIAPKATIDFVVSASTNATDGTDLSALYIVDNNLAPVMSMSFGACEQQLGSSENAFFNNLWEQAAAQGITVVVSSGDNGPAGCDDPNQFSPATGGLAVSGIASTPFNIALGGTQFNENGADSTFWSATNGPDQSSALGYIPEHVWNESCADPNQCGQPSLFASSGGASTLYSKPSWQVGTGVPNDGKRDLPDVSLDAAAGHDGYLLCQEGICTTNSSGQLINAELVGGTSAAAPTFAAIMSLIVQKTNSRQGQANFVLYPLAAAQNEANCNSSAVPQTQCIFNDITQGTNSVPGQLGANASTGYDLATGWGSLNAANLAANWQNETFRATNTTLQLSPASAVHGHPVTATVTVAPTSGTGSPTGDIALLGSTQGVDLGNLSSGAISSAVSSLPGGSYSVTANYGGDGTFGASASPGVAVSIAPEPSTIAFGGFLEGQSTTPSSIVNTTYGGFLALQVAVAGASGLGTPTGTLNFTDTFNGSTSPLLSSTLNSQGNAVVQETQLALGSHKLNVAYSGDASFNAGSAGPVTVNIAQGPTQTIVFGPTGALPNSSVQVEAIVLPNGAIDPTGTVQFMDGSNKLGTPVTLTNLVAAFTTTQLAAGANVITAVYSGDPNFLASTSGALTVIVGNPDFLLGVNPGNVVISGSATGMTNVLLTPGPGIGYFGPVSLACSGLPAGSSCTFLPAQPMLDGFDPAKVALSITRPALQAAAARVALNWPAQRFVRSGAGVAFVCFALLLWPGKRRYSKLALVAFLLWPRKRRYAKLTLVALLACFLISFNGCSGGQTSPPPPNPSSSSSFVLTVTASGGSGSQAVSHTVTLQVTVQ